MHTGLLWTVIGSVAGALTVLVALITLVANSLADLALAAWRPEVSRETA